MVFGVVFYQALENQVNGLWSVLPKLMLTLVIVTNVRPVTRMSCFDALVYTKVEIVGTTNESRASQY